MEMLKREYIPLADNFFKTSPLFYVLNEGINENWDGRIRITDGYYGE